VGVGLKDWRGSFEQLRGYCNRFIRAGPFRGVAAAWGRFSAVGGLIMLL
jgi:hypothetical protein